MDLKLISGIIAGLLGIICFIPYLRDIFKKKTTPHSYSWFIWGILQVTGIVAIITNEGGYYGTLGIAAGAVFCVITFFLSLKYGTRNITKTDTVSFIAALVAIVIWILTKNAMYSVILISLIDFIGFIPTMRKGYEEPQSETVSTYALAALSNVFALLALSSYSISTSLYLASLVLSNSLFVGLLLIRRRKNII